MRSIECKNVQQIEMRTRASSLDDCSSEDKFSLIALQERIDDARRENEIAKSTRVMLTTCFALISIAERLVRSNES